MMVIILTAAENSRLHVGASLFILCYIFVMSGVHPSLSPSRRLNSRRRGSGVFLFTCSSTCGAAAQVLLFTCSFTAILLFRCDSVYLSSY